MACSRQQASRTRDLTLKTQKYQKTSLQWLFFLLNGGIFKVLWDSHCLFFFFWCAWKACSVPVKPASPLASHHVPRICFDTTGWQRAGFVTKIPVALFGRTRGASDWSATPYLQSRVVSSAESEEEEEEEVACLWGGKGVGDSWWLYGRFQWRLKLRNFGNVH